ncbi:MAG TPA: outer membrane protein assembly factor BamD [Terracidiphilus sp.]|nr:outer membrane protein assembly factor BamD [Terracidiphilus sp.]
MNRNSHRIVAGLLAVLLAAGASAYAKDKRPKQKKQDLSANPLANVQSKQPDKELFDKAMIAIKKGKFDVARLDLQTLLNTYPDSEYKMRAKLAVGDSWFKEGGSAALTQAEAEYKDFETFFPNAPEAAEAQMKVGDIYYSEMEKPDRDYTNALDAEKEYREMINMYPDSTLIPRAKQRLRDVQEVLAERETQIGLYYASKEDYPAAIARLQTVVDTYPLYSKSDLALLTIGDAYAGEARLWQMSKAPGAVKERLRAAYLDKAAKAYDEVITKYPMAPRVEDAQDRLVAMNLPIPTPTQAAVAESEAEESSRQKIQFTDTLWGIVKHGPTVVEAAHVGDPSLEDPSRTLAPQVTNEMRTMLLDAANAGKTAAPAAVPATTAATEPPRSDQPSAAPLASGTPETTGLGVQIVNAPNSGGATESNALVKPVGPDNTAIPAAQAPAPAPDQINEIRPGTGQQSAANVNEARKKKAPKVDQSEESSSKKKKKKGLAKLNPF